MNPNPSLTFSRRKFLRQSAAALAVPLVAPQILAKSVAGANEKLNIAWVGFGNQGGGDLNACSNGNNVVALCDCDPRIWPKRQQQFPEAKFYKDFRKMLEEMGDKIDAVGVGTPDHTHFAVAYMAMSMGKHVFVQKPLVHSLWQARTLRKLAVEKSLVTQMGNQGHAFEGARLVKEWYEAGLIGEVREVITWTDRPKSGWGFNGQVKTEFPTAEDLPEGMDWDMPGGGGFIMVGEKGGIFHGDMRPNSPRLYPQARWNEYRENPAKQVPKTIPRVPGIHRDWIDSVRNGTKACSDFSYSGPLTEAILLGALAIRTGKGLDWDTGEMKISGNPEAAALINPEARKGWRPEDLA